MKILGLIAEYNPFHNGHLYHLNQSKKITNASHTIGIMSGHFLQRGEPALFDKWTRANIAVQNGVDLIIELPILYSTQSAELFANGSIKILDSLNCVDCVCFGSEHDDISIFKEIAKVLINEPINYKESLKKNLDTGMLFAKARSLALCSYFLDSLNISLDSNILNCSNNILAIEYIKALLSLNSNISAFLLKRICSSYNSTDISSNICSASAIRSYLKTNDNIHNISNVFPKHTLDELSSAINSNFKPVFDEQFFEFIRYSVLKEGAQINSYFDINEGIENKIINEIFNCTTLEGLLSNIKSKRYTQTKLKRILNNILLGIKKEDVLFAKYNTPSYIRVLAFNDKGREILRKIKSSSNTTIINKLANLNSNDENLHRFLKYDIESTNIYNLIYYKHNKTKGMMDYYNSPLYKKNISY